MVEIMVARLLSINVEEQCSISALGGDSEPGPVQALARLNAFGYDAVLVSLPVQDWSAEELLEEIQRINGVVPVIFVDTDASPQRAVRLARLGAFEVHGAGVSAEQLRRTVEAAVDYYRQRKLAARDHPHESWRRLLVGNSRAMERVAQVVRLIGARKSTVLITGETGTGKEMVARAIHMAGPRSHLPMVSVNCSALPENLLEAELFGHVKGAFTGAVSNRVGRFEQAHGSTLFLDEIGDLPLDLQAKLLRVLQEREFQRLGSSETIRVDIRVLAATNANLVEKVREGKFREDLYYRLNVVPLTLPPLRERLGDIPPLVNHFIGKICAQENLPPRRIGPEAQRRLQSYGWPGNVRQLENAVEMAIALSGERTMLYPSDFPLPSIRETKPIPITSTPVVAVPDDGLDYEQTVGRIERAILEQAMQKAGGNKKQAAEMLGLKRTTFAAKLKSLNAALSGAACPVAS